MQNITEQQIQSMAPNAAAVSNGRKISQKGGQEWAFPASPAILRCFRSSWSEH